MLVMLTNDCIVNTDFIRAVISFSKEHPEASKIYYSNIDNFTTIPDMSVEQIWNKINDTGI